MDAIILVGGKGSRLGNLIKDRPKPLAEINGTPFLDILLDYLAKQKIFDTVILSAGYLGHQIKERYRHHSYPFQIEVRLEEAPLGTGGAIAFCMEKVKTEDFFACNGDSFIAADLPKAIVFHRNHSGIGTIITRTVDNVARFGSIEVTQSSAIANFLEKGKIGKGIINAGMYFFRRSLFKSLSFPEKFSLESQGFPKMIQYGLYSFSSDNAFIDIGTEESFKQSQRFFTEIKT